MRSAIILVALFSVALAAPYKGDEAGVKGYKGFNKKAFYDPKDHMMPEEDLTVVEDKEVLEKGSKVEIEDMNKELTVDENEDEESMSNEHMVTKNTDTEYKKPEMMDEDDEEEEELSRDLKPPFIESTWVSIPEVANDKVETSTHVESKNMKGVKGGVKGGYRPYHW